MRKFVRGTISMLMAAMLIFPMTAFAAESAASPTIEPTVKIELSGRVPSKAEEFTVILEGKTADCPMPNGGEGNIYKMTFEGGGEQKIAPITYERVGIYQYIVYMEGGNISTGTYSKTVYNLDVYVMNREDGNGLEAVAHAYTDNPSEKKELNFENSYSGGGGSDGGGSGGGGGGKDKPTEGDGLTTIEDGNTPLGNIITEIIPDDMIPLSVLPKTGDTTNMALWLIMMAVSGSGLILLIVFGKRRGAAQ